MGPLKPPHGPRGREILYCFHFDAKSNCLSISLGMMKSVLSLVIYKYSFTIVCLLFGRLVNASLVGWLVGFWNLPGSFASLTLRPACTREKFWYVTRVLGDGGGERERELESERERVCVRERECVRVWPQ